MPLNERDEQLLKKAERILKENICSDESYPWKLQPMIEPGKGWGGIWNWDSAFHAIGALNICEELAKQQILGFFSFQCENGMLPDVIWENGEIEDHFSKPPVMAYAVHRIYLKTGDLEFVKNIYPVLAKNVEFWEQNRCVNGLYHYDAEKRDDCTEEKYIINVKYESGWDNSPRFDDDDTCNLWAIDLNCFMVMTYDAMSALSAVSGADGTQYIKKSETLKKLINEKLYDKETGAYFDYNFSSDKFINVLTPASFMPLFAGVADKEKAARMNEVAKKHFMPSMPTVAYDDKSYSNDYWRGPCWLNVAYFAAKGLKDYGFTETAETIKETILDNVKNDGEFIHENYDSLTGKGLCCDHFSWSCVFVMEFILNF